VVPQERTVKLSGVVVLVGPSMARVAAHPPGPMSTSIVPEWKESCSTVAAHKPGARFSLLPQADIVDAPMATIATAIRT